MRKPHVLHVINSLPPEGAEQLLLDLIRISLDSEFRFSVCCTSGGGTLVREIENLGVDVHVFDMANRFDARILPKIIRIIRKEETQVVHTHLFTADFWGRIAAVACGVPCVITTAHNSDTWKGWHHFLADQILATRTNRICAVSGDVKQFLVKAGRIPKGKIDVILNGIDVARFAHTSRDSVIREKLRNEFGIRSPQTLVIGIIARLVPPKDHKTMINALRDARNMGIDAQLLVVGDGPLKAELTRYVSQTGMAEHVVFAGIRRDIPEILAAVDVFSLSSIIEGLPIALLEAMAARKVIVSTAVGGIPEVIRNRQSGLLVPPQNPEALADAIAWVARHPDEADHMAQAALTGVRASFDIRGTADHYLELYRATLGQGGHPVAQVAHGNRA